MPKTELKEVKQPTKTSEKTTTQPSKPKNETVEKLSNNKLKTFVEEWMGVPYLYAGKTKTGVDCSNFTATLLREVYGFPSNFYMPSASLADKAKKIDKSQAKQGDLVFFSIGLNGKISHVGIWLENNKFVHASTSQGVVISDLTDPYYAKRFSFIGRVDP
jgi:lipoprotein Spr